MTLVKGWGQTGGSGRMSETTLVETPSGSSTPRAEIGRTPRGEDPVSTQLRFRRAFAIGYAMWASYIAIDWAVVRYLHAGSLSYFLFLRLALLVVVAPVLLRLHRGPTLTRKTLTTADLLVYTGAAVTMSLMCLQFRGIASPYLPGFCLVLISRTVTAQDDPWKRGLVMNGIPVAAFFAVLLGAAAFSTDVATQLRDPAAIATLVLNGSYVFGAYVALVVGGHLIWSLRRQVFEARSLGRYRLKHRLATGGMGEVWVAYHAGLKRDVAVKILKPEEQERSAGALARFEREVRATAELAHPNTVRVFDYGGTEDGLWYYVMELLEGETLAEHVTRQGPLAPARAIHIVGQAARALAEAHERGIVHRDIKPENLFLTSLGGEHDFVKVIDFGIAKVDSVDGTTTGTGWIMGTPAYMSPEVAMGEAADARSDVYALGEVLYFLLCGLPPFRADSVAALLFAQVNERACSPSRVLGRQLPSDVEAVVARALEKEPSARYSTAAELALALSSCALAGKWTFGDAAVVARQSSRPPPPDAAAVVSAALSLRPPRVPKIESEPPPKTEGLVVASIS